MLRDKLGAGHNVFLPADHWQVRAGEVWLERIREELECAKVLVFLLSPNSISRPWVNFEAGAAWLARKRIIPVYFGGLDRGNLPKPYSDFQALDLRTHYYELVRDVFDWLEEGRRLPPIPFPPWDPLVAALQAEWIDWSKIIDQNRYLIISGGKTFHRARSVEYVTKHP